MGQNGPTVRPVLANGQYACHPCVNAACVMRSSRGLITITVTLVPSVFKTQLTASDRFTYCQRPRAEKKRATEERKQHICIHGLPQLTHLSLPRILYTVSALQYSSSHTGVKTQRAKRVPGASYLAILMQTPFFKLLHRRARWFVVSFVHH